MRIISLSIILFLLGFLMACAPGEQITGEEQVTIADITSEPSESEGGNPIEGEQGVTIAEITSNPMEYEGRIVTLSGEYRGWEAGHGAPPVTRSDWILKDDTGVIYVTGGISLGLDPVEERGTKIMVYGVVKVKDNQAYIEAEIVR